MLIELLTLGKTREKALDVLIEDYSRRINFYVQFKIRILPGLRKKGGGKVETQNEETRYLLQNVAKSDLLIVLDEKGCTLSSGGFASFLQKQLNRGSKKIIFVTGGAYGFSENMYQRADARISLSAMTFTHQMVRLIFTEQLYRAFTIIKGESYHH